MGLIDNHVIPRAGKALHFTKKLHTITFIAHDDVLEDILNDKLKIGPAVTYGLVHFEGDENCKGVVFL